MFRVQGVFTDPGFAGSVQKVLRAGWVFRQCKFSGQVGVQAGVFFSRV